ncbi:hypothetical protein [Streptococcus henryi]|uniref:hypothetical protein n=1 Tax=Streptococcus henryi TaxID=439219 RepID=UPI0003A21046|nr:hypothetical protein [Streptococcus henryi]
MKSLKLVLIFIAITVFIGVLSQTSDYMASISLHHFYALMGIRLTLFYGLFPYFKKRKEQHNV